MKTIPTTLDEARAAKAKVAAWLADPSVVGVGITRIGDGYGIKVNLSHIVSDDLIPEDIDGVPVRSEVVGKIKKR